MRDFNQHEPNSLDFINKMKYVRQLGSFNPSRPDPGRTEKINLNFYFHTSLWCFKRFYEGLKGFDKIF